MENALFAFCEGIKNWESFVQQTTVTTGNSIRVAFRNNRSYFWIQFFLRVTHLVSSLFFQIWPSNKFSSSLSPFILLTAYASLGKVPRYKSHVTTLVQSSRQSSNDKCGEFYMGRKWKDATGGVSCLQVGRLGNFTAHSL